ncbi:13761_t:CDS:2 [Acaulospora colombiana]|uniref:13761_t:CDS:1 n=1 Tax=Acaulospora colombiana TaxID=27376 RepID=A0ACA9LJM5_9GLOM|nr:13761_t:CDS:2 [Acaulospora colombiana]
MATQAAHVRRKHETDKGESNPDSIEISEAPFPLPTRQQRPLRTKSPQNNSPLKGKVKKNESPFLADSENFSEINALSSSTIEFPPLAVNKSAEEINIQAVINEGIVENTIPNRFNNDSFLQMTDFSKAPLPPGNNDFVELQNSQSYDTYFTNSVHQTTDATGSIDNGVVLTTNIGSTDNSRGVYAFDNITPLNTQETVTQYNNARISQEITRVTLSSVHKVEGNKESAPVKAASTSFIQHNFITSENIIEKNIGHTDPSVFDVPTINDVNRIGNDAIIQLQNDIDPQSNPFSRNEDPSKLPSNPQATVDQPPVKAGRGRPKKVTATTRGRPKKVKPSETNAEGITTEVKSVEGLSVATVDQSTIKVKHGKRGRPKMVQTGEPVTNSDGTISESVRVPKKRGRPKKDESNANLVRTTTGGKAGKRGRPRKIPKIDSQSSKGMIASTKHKGRGRPRKVLKVEGQPEKTMNESTTAIKKRGRPRKEAPESNEPKEAPESGGLKDMPESSGLQEASGSNEPKAMPESGEPNVILEPNKDESIATENDAKTGKRGRPKKIPISGYSSAEPGKEPVTSKKRGRPKKEVSENNELKETIVKTGKRGRPRKKSKTEEEVSLAISNEPGVASGSVEHQPAIFTVNIDNANVTTEKILIGTAEEVPEESIDELIDELTTTN